MKQLHLYEALYSKLSLRFNARGKFRILMVSDIHGGVGYSLKTPAALEALLKGTKPDLVLLGGDIAGPGVIHVENEQQLRDMLDTLCEPLERAGIPWAHVYGNHDNNFGLANQAQQPIYESYPHCVSKTGPRDVSGTGNYVLPIRDHTGSKILFNVFGLDSHRGLKQFCQQYHLPQDTTVVLPQHNNSGGSEGTIHFSQVMWYWQTSEMLEAYNGGKIPAMMYMHIPLPEMALIAKNRSECGFKGYQGQAVACSELNSGLFSTILQRGDVKGIFFGHDHENDFSGIYCGVRMGFDGFLSYHACQEESIRGGRVIDLCASNPEIIDTHMVRVRDFL